MKEGAIILIVDDEVQIRRFLRLSLEAHGYKVHEAENGEDCIREFSTLRPDFVILDLGLPDMDGLDVVRRLREWSRTPILILSVRDSDTEKIAALDAGADDYLTKPFSVGELLARLRVAQRHVQPMPETSIFEVNNVAVDLSRRSVTVGGEPVKLTPTEYSLLKLLIQNAGKALTHKQILREVWGPQYVDEIHYLRVYVTQLRQKLEVDPTRPKIILTEAGVGYRIAVPDEEV